MRHVHRRPAAAAEAAPYPHRRDGGAGLVVAEALRALIETGVDVFRLNLSHGRHEGRREARSHPVIGAPSDRRKHRGV